MAGVKKYGSAKESGRMRRKVSIRKKISGSALRPRLTVFRSLKHIYCQAVDDTSKKVLATSSDLDKALFGEVSGKKKAEVAKVIGQAVAKKLLAQQVSMVVFDRNGYIYHGRVKAVADGAREGGLKF